VIADISKEIIALILVKISKRKKPDLFTLEYEGNTFLLKVGNNLANDTASDPRRSNFFINAFSF
jgi:hypothetical protein